jgi:hypothetical protein
LTWRGYGMMEGMDAQKETTGPGHAWDGTDDGHNCRRCPSDSIWRCDRLAHIRKPADLLTSGQAAALKESLAGAARGRHRAAGAAANFPLS